MVGDWTLNGLCQKVSDWTLSGLCKKVGDWTLSCLCQKVGDWTLTDLCQKVNSVTRHCQHNHNDLKVGFKWRGFPTALSSLYMALIVLCDRCKCVPLCFRGGVPRTQKLKTPPENLELRERNKIPSSKPGEGKNGFACFVPCQ